MKTLIPDRPLPETLQEFFDIAWRWAHREDFKLSKEGSSCLYRNITNTNACLIGAAIPDSKYKKKFDSLGSCLDEVIDEVGFNFNCAGRIHLRDLQLCHDNSDTESICIHLLQDFAKEHELIIPKL